jgi:TPR repeat protein
MMKMITKTHSSSRSRPAAAFEVVVAAAIAISGCATPSPNTSLAELRSSAEAGDTAAQLKLGSAYLDGRETGVDTHAGAMWIERAANNGNRDAQFLLGYLCAEGIGLPKDLRQAADWYESAAEQWHPVAQNNLGVAYRDGLGVEQNYDTALLWLRRAADQDLPEANLNLGSMYENGRGVPRDETRASEFYRRGAVRDNARAAVLLAELFDEGRGVTRDSNEALKWYGVAAAAGDEEAELQINRILTEKLEPEAELSPFELALRSAEQGSPRAQLALGFKYEHGQGVARDIDQALRWYEKAASQGSSEADLRIARIMASDADHRDRPTPFEVTLEAAEAGDPEAQRALAFKYEHGLGIEEDPEAAIEWYRKAAEQGNTEALLWLSAYAAASGEPAGQPSSFERAKREARNGSPESQFALGLHYEEGRGVDRDLEEALRLYEKAASQGYRDAQFRMSSILAEDPERANQANFFPWARREADLGAPDAQYALGLRYDDGRGVRRDKELAVLWYRKAADQGHIEAQQALGGIYDKGRGVPENSEEAQEHISEISADVDEKPPVPNVWELTE